MGEFSQRIFNLPKTAIIKEGDKDFNLITTVLAKAINFNRKEIIDAHPREVKQERIINSK